MNRIYNFSAGPAILPESVLEQAAEAVREFGGSGMSMLELSHRGPHYEAVHFETRDLLLKALDLDPAEWSAIFLGGGASTQFAMVPMNFLKQGETADYIDTGTWSTKAIQEAQHFGCANVCATSKGERYSCLPTSFDLTDGAKYVHLTTNNTIEGTEWPTLPAVGATPLVADFSSDILARKFDYSKLSLLYAGAQKNLGPAGVTMVVARKEFLASARKDIPTIFRYATHDSQDSLYNTPPTFAIYVVGLVLKWIAAQGGVAAVESMNRMKASALYTALDSYPEVYEPAVTVKEHRSLMNVTFRLKEESREKEFLSGAESVGMDGLKGHRSVGGFRASIYNAFPIDGAYALAQYMAEFAREE